MRNRTFLMITLFIVLIVPLGCRSRRNAEQPQVVPPVATAAPDRAVPVVSSDSEFSGAEESEEFVLSSDVEEATRQARQRGFIADAFFAFDSGALDSSAQAALSSSAEWLRANPHWRIRIEGHCDERGTEQYNLALGERRAESAAAYLVAQGIDRSRIDTSSLGEERPFAAGSNEAAWAENRRAHVKLSR